MMGWEEVEDIKIPIYLARSMPLRAMGGFLELIIRSQVEIHKSQPSQVEQTFQFMDSVYRLPNKRVEVNIVDHDHLMESYSHVYIWES